jgi:hypothetical protein
MRRDRDMKNKYEQSKERDERMVIQRWKPNWA